MNINDFKGEKIAVSKNEGTPHLRGGTVMTEKKRGRPFGTTVFGELKVPKTHRMTPTAHDWIRENKEEIEKQARRKSREKGK